MTGNDAEQRRDAAGSSTGSGPSGGRAGAGGSASSGSGGSASSGSGSSGSQSGGSGSQWSGRGAGRVESIGTQPALSQPDGSRSDRSVVERAKAKVEDNHLPRERVEYGLQAALRDPLRKIDLVGRAEFFFGSSFANKGVVVLTTARLLLVSERDRAQDWVDLQFDRSTVRAVRPYTRGKLTVMELQTGIGPKIVVVPAVRLAEVLELGRRLGVQPARR